MHLSLCTGLSIDGCANGPASPIRSRVQLPRLDPGPIQRMERHIHGFPQRPRRPTHRLSPFAMCAALPRSDYYGDSAPRPRPRRTCRLARTLRCWRSDRGSHVPRRNPWCGRWSAVPLAARTAVPFGAGRRRTHAGHTQSLKNPRPGAGCVLAEREFCSVQRLPSPTSTARADRRTPRLASPWHLR